MTRTAARREAARLKQRFPAYTFAYSYVRLQGGHVVHAVRVCDPGTQRTALIIGLPGFARANEGIFAWGNERATRRAAAGGVSAMEFAQILRGEIEP